MCRSFSFINFHLARLSACFLVLQTPLPIPPRSFPLTHASTHCFPPRPHSILRTPAEMTALRRSIDGRRSVGFVPTMGALHRGHLQLMEVGQWLGRIWTVRLFFPMFLSSPFLISPHTHPLIKRARQENDVLIISVFVNPTVSEKERVATNGNVLEGGETRQRLTRPTFLVYINDSNSDPTRTLASTPGSWRETSSSPRAQVRSLGVRSPPHLPFQPADRARPPLLIPPPLCRRRLYFCPSGGGHVPFLASLLRSARGVRSACGGKCPTWPFSGRGHHCD